MRDLAAYTLLVRLDLVQCGCHVTRLDGTLDFDENSGPAPVRTDELERDVNTAVAAGAERCPVGR